MAREMARERMAKHRPLPHRFGENYLGRKRVIVTGERRKNNGKLELRCDIGGRVRWIAANRIRTSTRRPKRDKIVEAPKKITNPNVEEPSIMRAVSRLLRGWR